MTIKFSDLLVADSKLFAKSEFAPANEDWPALSFSSNKIAADFQKIYKRGKDFLIFVGTSNPDDTPEQAHRQNLLSVISIDPKRIISTKTIVSPVSWARAQAKYPDRWDVSLPILQAWEVIGFPSAHEKLPATYIKFRNPGTRGHPIPIESSDIDSLRQLELQQTPLNLSKRILENAFSSQDEDQLRKELSRLAEAIRADVNRAGSETNGSYPHRSAPNISDVYSSLLKKWRSTGGCCALCSQKINLKNKNKLLQMSRDRIDSSDKSYSDANLQITHLGCNLGKSDATTAEWKEFLSHLRLIESPKREES